MTRDIINRAILVYRGMLETTRDTFGKGNMTEEVICSAIKQAGDVAWRVMTIADEEPERLTLISAAGEEPAAEDEPAGEGE